MASRAAWRAVLAAPAVTAAMAVSSVAIVAWSWCLFPPWAFPIIRNIRQGIISTYLICFNFIIGNICSLFFLVNRSIHHVFFGLCHFGHEPVHHFQMTMNDSVVEGGLRGNRCFRHLGHGEGRGHTPGWQTGQRPAHSTRASWYRRTHSWMPPQHHRAPTSGLKRATIAFSVLPKAVRPTPPHDTSAQCHCPRHLRSSPARFRYDRETHAPGRRSIGAGIQMPMGAGERPTDSTDATFAHGLQFGIWHGHGVPARILQPIGGMAPAPFVQPRTSLVVSSGAPLAVVAPTTPFTHSESVPAASRRARWCQPAVAALVTAFVPSA